MSKQIEKFIKSCRTNGVALYIYDNGQPDYLDIKTLCNFAMIDFEEKDGEVVSVVLDDGNKRETIISVDQLYDLINKQTGNRGYFYVTKTDALRDLNYMLTSGNIDKETYGELIEGLYTLKF